MDQNDIQLEKLTKQFEYQKLANEIDACDSIDDIKRIAKAYIKLYFKQQEVLVAISKRFGN